MKINTLLITAFLAFAAHTTATEPTTTQTTYTIHIESSKTPDVSEQLDDVTVPQKKGLKELSKRYFTSILPGIAIGATTGYLEKYFEKQFGGSLGAVLLCLFMEINARNATTNELKKDLKRYVVQHSPELIELSARLASWYFYLA